MKKSSIKLNELFTRASFRSILQIEKLQIIMHHREIIDLEGRHILNSTISVYGHKIICSHAFSAHTTSTNLLDNFSINIHFLDVAERAQHTIFVSKF